MAGISPGQGRALLSSGEFSDFTIVCKGREWKVHKMVVCSGSEYFRAVAKGNFDGGATDRCELKEEDPGLIQLVLNWMYTGEYETETALAPRLWGDCGEGKDGGNGWEEGSDWGNANDEAADDGGDENENDAGEGGSQRGESIDAIAVDDHEESEKESDWVAYYTNSWDRYASLSAKKAEQSLLTQLFLYTVADRLGITDLQEAASEAFVSMMEMYQSEAYLAGILQQLCDNTATMDNLRSKVFASCLNNLPWSSEWGGTSVVSLMKKYEPVAWSYAAKWKPVEAKQNDRIALLTAQLMRVEVDRDSATTASNLAEKSIRSYQIALTNLENYFRKGSFSCKSCAADLVTNNAGFDVRELIADPSGKALSVPKVYVVCRACKYKEFTNAGEQLVGDKAYASL